MAKYVSVIGGINIDIKGIAFSGNKNSDSHPGKVIFSPGGVARNTAESLARLKVPTYLFGVVGKDDSGKRILKESKSAGVNVSNVITSKESPTGIYLSVSNKSGFLNYGVNDMNDSLKEITTEYISKNEKIISGSSFLMLDTNIDINVINFIIEIANNNKIPVLIDAVSTVKANSIKSITGKVDYLSLNIREFVGMFGRFEDNQILINRLRKGDFSHFKTIHLKMGKSGVWLIGTAESRIHKYSSIPLKVVEPSGAGDAYNAGFVFAVLNNYDIKDAVKLGICAAAMSLTCEKSVSENISEEMLLALYKKHLNVF